MQLPHASDLIQSKNWTNYTAKELVTAGRLSAADAAAQLIAEEQKKRVDAGIFPPLSELRKTALQWENLKSEILDLLNA